MSLLPYLTHGNKTCYHLSVFVYMWLRYFLFPDTVCRFIFLFFFFCSSRFKVACRYLFYSHKNSPSINKIPEFGPRNIPCHNITNRGCICVLLLFLIRIKFKKFWIVRIIYGGTNGAPFFLLRKWNSRSKPEHVFRINSTNSKKKMLSIKRKAVTLTLCHNNCLGTRCVISQLLPAGYNMKPSGASEISLKDKKNPKGYSLQTAPVTEFLEKRLQK